MRIWLGTWNCEQQFPSAAQITAWANHANGTVGAIANCDIVVMGFQESSRGAGIPNLPGFQNILHLTANGQTKNVENCQAVFVWQNANANNANGAVINPNMMNDTLANVTTRTLKRKIKFWAEYGKGSASTCIVFRPTIPNNPNPLPWRIVISSAHLDSKSATKRTSQVNDAQNSASATAHGNIWDVQFLMGDLNFRLNKTVNRLPVMLYSQIVTQRAQLFADDSLQFDAALGVGAGGGWVFPPPYQGAPGPNANYTLPTYKKIYSPAAAQIQAMNAAAIIENGGGTPMVHVPLVYDFKIDPKTGAVKEGSRAGQYDCGWLDRIGYRIRGGSQRQVTQVWGGSPATLILSDHAPVYSVYDIT